MPSDVKHWASKFKSATDSDATIAAMGKYYTCAFMYDMGEAKVIIEMHDGKVKAIKAALTAKWGLRRISRELGVGVCTVYRIRNAAP